MHQKERERAQTNRADTREPNRTQTNRAETRKSYKPNNTAMKRMRK